MNWITPITDRTQADIDFVKENMNGIELKGARNASDLNRIGNNMLYLEDILNTNGYPVKLNDIKIDWTKTDMPSYEDILHILTELQKIKNIFDIADIPIMPINTFIKMNEIEQFLLDIKRFIDEKVYRYSGTFYSGEDWGIEAFGTRKYFIQYQGEDILFNNKNIRYRGG